MWRANSVLLDNGGGELYSPLSQNRETPATAGQEKRRRCRPSPYWTRTVKHSCDVQGSVCSVIHPSTQNFEM